MMTNDKETISKLQQATELIDIVQRATGSVYSPSDAIAWLRSEKMDEEADELQELLEDIPERKQSGMLFALSLRVSTRRNE